MNVDHLSLVTTPIYLLKHGAPVSVGSGFLYETSIDTKSESVVFLITNFHVFTGFEPGKGSVPHDCIGDSVMFFTHYDAGNPNKVCKYHYELFDSTGTPLWISDSATSYDVAALPVVRTDKPLFVLNEGWATSPLRVRSASQVLLIGYPYGFFDSLNMLPIWKTGSVASEPEADFSGVPVFLVDASVYRGMSGCPVLATSIGVYEQESGGFAVGGSRKLLGVFSAIHEKEEYHELINIEIAKQSSGVMIKESMQLGRVWKHVVISQILNGFSAQKWLHRKPTVHVEFVS